MELIKHVWNVVKHCGMYLNTVECN